MLPALVYVLKPKFLDRATILVKETTV